MLCACDLWHSLIHHSRWAKGNSIKRLSEKWISTPDKLICYTGRTAGTVLCPIEPFTQSSKIQFNLLLSLMGEKWNLWIWTVSAFRFSTPSVNTVPSSSCLSNDFNPGLSIIEVGTQLLFSKWIDVAEAIQSSMMEFLLILRDMSLVSPEFRHFIVRNVRMKAWIPAIIPEGRKLGHEYRVI